MGVPPHHPDRQVLPGGWVGGPEQHVHPRVAPAPVPPHNLHPGDGPQRILAAEVEPSCLLPTPPSTSPSTKPPTSPQFPLPRAGPGAGCLRPLWPAVMNEDALSGASLQSSASTREDYINTPRE